MNTTTVSPLHRPDAEPAGRWSLVPFASLALPVGWALLSVPLVVDLPLAPFVLATTALGLVLPALLLARRESPGGARALLRDALRLPRPLWLMAPAALAVPVTTWTAAATLGVATSPSPSFLLSLALANVLSSVVVINLWEEMVWAGFVQRRASARRGYVAGSVVTALLFTGIHLPLSLYDADGPGDVAVSVGVMVVAGIGLRLLIGAFDVWGRGSILALGLIHATFNASSELVEPDADWVRYAATLALGLAVAAVLRGRR